MSVLVTSNHAVTLGAVAAAAIELCGKDRIWVDTGGTTVGIRVPDENAEEVRERARVLSGVVDEPTGPEGPDDPVPTPAPKELEQGQEVKKPPVGRRGPRSKKTSEEV